MGNEALANSKISVFLLQAGKSWNKIKLTSSQNNFGEGANERRFGRKFGY